MSDSSTALIVPYGTTSAPGAIHSVRSSGSGASSRLASTTTSAPRTHDSQSSVTVTGRPRSASSRAANASRLSGRREWTRISSSPSSTRASEPDVPVRGAARADVAEHAGAARREVAGAERGHRAGPHVGDPGRVDDRARLPGPGVEQREQAHLGRQPGAVVAVEVADDLHAREPERAHDAAQDVEVPVDGRVGLEVHARLEDGLPLALRAQRGLDRVEDLVVVQREPLDVRAVEVRQLERRHQGVGGGAPSTHSPSSVFQIGARALISSMISRAPANASPRWAAETATITDGSLSGTRPTRCSAAAAHSPWRSTAAATIAVHLLGRHLRVGLVVEPADVAGDALEHHDRARARVAHARDDGVGDSGSSRIATCGAVVAPPLTGGISASSSPAASGWSAAAYSRLTAITSGRPPARSSTAASASETRAPSGRSSSSVSRPGALAEDGEEADGDLHARWLATS